MRPLLASIPVLAAAAVLGAAEPSARVPARGLVLDAPGTDFRVANFTRDPIGPKDILIEILYSGICHSDIHAALNDSGEMAVVGLPPGLTIGLGELMAAPHRRLYGSIVGGIREHQACMDWSLAHGVLPETVVIPATPEAVAKAYRDVIDGKVRFRYVLDLSTLPQD